MEDEEIEKPVEGNPKGGSTTGEKENPRTTLPEYDPNLPFKEPASREDKWISTLGSAALESKSASSIAGTNFSISSAGKDLYTPIDLAKGIPDQYEREKFISDHGSRMVQLLDPNKYGIRFNRELSDYAAFKEKNYKTETKKFLDELDENQGFLDAAWRTVAKAAGSLALNVGGLVPLVYGLGAGLFTWDAKNIFNNTLFDAWDYMQEGLDKHTVVYGGSDYHSGDKNVFARFISNPMKSLNADIVPAAAFVAGAVATQMVAAAAAPVTGGASLIGNTARLGALATRTFAKSARILRGLDQLSDFENMRKIASLTQKYRATLGTATTMVRTAGYESSLIARSTYDLTLSKAKENYINLKRNELAESGYSQEEIDRITLDPNFISGGLLAKMQKSAEDASELAWFTNIPLVGFSNMIQFSKVFASGYKINRAISRLNPLKMTGVVKEGGKFAAKAETMGTARRLAGYSAVGLKQGVVEGFEEYAQGVIEQGYSDYWSSRFSESSVKQSVDFMDAMTKAARNYGGSVEGFDSMAIGFLMGMVGIRLPIKFDAQTGKLSRGWQAYGGVREEFRELKKQIEKDKATAEKLNDAPINPMLKAQFENLSRNFAIQSDMEEALKNGDLFTYKNKEYEQFHSYVATRHKMGVSDTIFQDLEEFEKMDLAEFNKQFATPEVHEFSEESRKAALEKARESAKNIIDAHERVDTAFEDTKMAADFARKNFKGVTDPFGLTDALKEQMTFLYGATLNQAKREKELEGQVRDLTDGKISPSIVNTLLSEIAGISKEGQANFTSQAKELYNAALNEWKESDPTSYNLYHKQVEPLLQDLIKIKQYKSKISKMYDVLFTNKGATQFMSIYEQLAKNAAELAQEEAIKKKEEEQKNARSSNQAAKTNADLKSLGADDKIDARLASEAQLADQLLSEMLKEADPDAAAKDIEELKTNLDADSIINTLQRTPALFKAVLERLEKQNKLIPGLNNIDQLPEILAEDPMAAARIAGALNEILTELKNNQPAKPTVAPLDYVDPEDHYQPAPDIEEAKSLAEIYNTKSEELKKQGIFQPGTNVTELSIIPITHDKLIDRTTGQVVRNDETGKFEVWADSTGLPSDHPTDTKKINSPEFLNNSDLTENNREATFKIADNEWNKEARDAKDIAIDVYHGDTFIGRLPAWREGMPVHLLALRQAVVSQEVGLSVAEELGEVTETKEELEAKITARKAKLKEELDAIEKAYNSQSTLKKMLKVSADNLATQLHSAEVAAEEDIQALEEKLANLSPEVNPNIEAKKAELENAEDERLALINKRNNDATVRKAIKDSNSGVITIEQLDQILNVWNFKNGFLDLTIKIDRLKSEIKSLEASSMSDIEIKRADIEARKQEEFDQEYEGRRAATFSRFNPNGPSQELTKEEHEEVEELIEAAIENGNVTAEQLYDMIRAEGYIYTTYGSQASTLAYLKNRLTGKTTTKAGGNLLDDTIAKYNKELAALETTPDIAAKKADIEKRREEELNDKETIYKNSLSKFEKNPNKDVLSEEKIFTRYGKISEVGFRKVDKTSALAFVFAYNSNIDKINAKYDAELAALESTPSVSNINAKITEIEQKIKAFDKTIEEEFEEGDYSKVLGLAEKQVAKGSIPQTAKNIQLITNYPKLFEELIKATDARNKTIAAFDKEKVLVGNPNELPIYGIESTINPTTGRLEIKWVETRKERITNIQLLKINNYAAEELGNYKATLQSELAELEKIKPAEKLPQTTTIRRGIIDNNFDEIVAQLAASKINVFFNNNNQFKQC
jgi:hypothetical protein